MIDEMPDDTNLDRLKIEGCRDICEDIPNLMIVLCTDMGTPDQNIAYLSLEELATAKTGRLHCLVIPAEPGIVDCPR